MVGTSGGDVWWGRMVGTSGGDVWWGRMVGTSGGEVQTAAIRTQHLIVISLMEVDNIMSDFNDL